MKKRKGNRSGRRKRAASSTPPAFVGNTAVAAEPEHAAIVELVPAEHRPDPEHGRADDAEPEAPNTPAPQASGAYLRAEPTANDEPPHVAEEHRASPRVSIEVDIHLSSDSHFFSGLSGDISEGGLFVSTYRPLTTGSEVEVELSLPGSGDAILARGRVRWIREHSTGQPRGVGIAFEALSEETRERIHRFCIARPPLYYDDLD